MRTITWPHADIVLWRIYASLEEIEGHDGRDGSIPLFDPVNLTRLIIWESSMTYLVINNNSYSNNNNKKRQQKQQQQQQQSMSNQLRYWF